MLLRSPCARPGRRRGAAIAEFAVVVPVLFLLVIGIIEFGRLVMVAQMTTNAGREAARYATQSGATTDDAVAEYARSYLLQAGIANSAVAGVAVESQTPSGNWARASNPSTVSPGAPIRVTVSVDFDQVSWLPARFFVGNGTRVEGVSVARKE